MTKEKKDILQVLINKKQYFTDMLEAWEKVEVISKKDGSPYKNLSKNFTNAIIENGIGLRPNPLLKVSFNTVQDKEVCSTGYGHDTVYCTRQVNSLTLDKWKGDKSRLIKESFIVPYYFLTVDEIKESIEQRKKSIKERIENLNQDIKNFESISNTIDNNLLQLSAILNNLKHTHSREYNSDIYYAIRDYIFNIMKYM